MKKLFSFTLILTSCFAFAQNFTWLKGSNTNGTITGIYGTLGTPSSSNTPGSRHGGATWVDASGNLWLFGGEGISATPTLSWLSDLWKYDPTTNQWTWINGSNSLNQIGLFGTQGIASSANQPGAREFAMTWVDASGNFWLFGGDGFASTTTFGRLSDVWKYNPSTNQWTWMNGNNIIDQYGVYGTMGIANSTNKPGARYASATYVDASGNFWMCAGKGYGASGLDGWLSDLWKYNPTSNQWTWMHGPTATGQIGIYGTLGVGSVANNIGGREFPSFWSDASGNLYFMGGRGYASVSNIGYLNDLWKYNIALDTWTWIGGTNINNQLGFYGTNAVMSSTNIPGGRYATAAWKDLNGNFWLFGGYGWSSTNSLANLNDMWQYNPTTNQWAWMKGSSNTTNVAGVYGTQGVANTNNFPGARHYNTSWRGLNSKFWLFGGFGIDNNNSNTADNMNDLWGYVAPCNPDSVTSANNLNFCTNNSVTLNAFNQYSATVSWFNSASSTSAIATGSVYTTPLLNAIGLPTTYTFYAQANNCTMTPKTVIILTVNPTPTITATSSNTVVCIGNSATITATGANTYTWSNGVMNNSFVATPSLVTIYNYSVIGTSTAGCTNTISASFQAVQLPSVAINGTNQVCSGNSITLNASGANNYTWSTGSNSNSIIISPTTVLFVTLIGSDLNGCIKTTSNQINVFPNPILSFSPTIHNYCLNEIRTATVGGATTYSWSNSITTNSVVLNTTQVGINSLTAIGTNTNGCVSTQNFTYNVSNCVGIQSYNKLDNLINIFPNPNTGNFTIEKLSDEILQMKLYNNLGQLILEDKLSDALTSFNTVLPKGLYYLKITDKEYNQKTLKLKVE